MANYKEIDIAGKSWQRCRAVTITNPLPGGELDPQGNPVVPTAFFQEEQVVAFPNKAVVTDVGFCKLAFNPVAEIPLLDPTTGAATGQTATHAQLYAILYSLYMQAAQLRDGTV